MPEVIQKILHRAAQAAMIIGRSQEDDIGLVYAFLQLGVAGQIVSGVGIVQGHGFLEKIQDVDLATGLAKLVRNMVNDHPGNRIALQAADDGQDM